MAKNYASKECFKRILMKMAVRKNIHNMPQGPPNPGFMEEKVQKGDFLKKTLCSKYSNYEYATIGSVE